MSEDFGGLLQAFGFHRAACEYLGSPFSARVLAILAEEVAAGGPFADLMCPWVGPDAAAALNDAAPLRMLGGLHYLTLSGADPGLAALYPARSSGADKAALKAELRRAAVDHRAALERFIPSAPQTNEVRRSICLVGGFLTVAARTGLPLRCLEIGSSAGLNQNWSRYRYRFGEAGAWGDAASAVAIGTAWAGPPPPLGEAVVAQTRGCDLRPIDLSDPDQALRLEAYVWADQTDRLERLRAAVAVARDHPSAIDRAEAADWVEAHAMPAPGFATVLFHSVVWQYLPGATQTRIQAAIERAGQAATPEAPVAWLRMEPDPDSITGPMQIRLTTWPPGEEILLARAHPHGAEVAWLNPLGPDAVK